MGVCKIKKAVIIGATSGIGRAVAQLLWQKGVDIAIAGRRENLLADFASSKGGRVIYAPLDVTAEDAGECLAGLAERLGGADLILLCSGIGTQNQQLDAEKELQTTATNVVGFTRMIDAAFNYFKARGGGHIAAVTSIAGTRGLGAAPAYSATKRYQNTYIQSLAQLSNTNGFGIKFTDIRPGFVGTALLNGGSYPLLMKPDHVAHLIVRALERQRRTVVVDWRYGIVTALWRLIPRCIWERLPIKTKI